MRLKDVVATSRDLVAPQVVGEVAMHYSIPAVEAVGTARLEKTASMDSAKARVAAGDVLISRLNPRKSRVIVVADSAVPRLASPEFVALRPRRCSGAFLAYWLSNEAVTGQLSASVTSVTRSHQRVEPSAILNLRFPELSIDEQERIVRALDDETAGIDAFIADQERLIALLEERRLAVLQGIALQAPGWRRGNIRAFAKMRTGHTPNRSTLAYWVDTYIPWFTLADVWQLREGRQYLSETKERISAAGLANSAAELLPAGTVVLSRTASVGFTGIMAAPMATSQDFWNWVPGPHLRPEFLWYQLRAMRPYFMRLVQGSTHKTIYQSDAASLTVSVPSLEEQDRVVRRLDAETASIDAAIADAHEAIALSKERRAALISAAVTGRIDVTGRQRVLV